MAVAEGQTSPKTLDEKAAPEKASQEKAPQEKAPQEKAPQEKASLEKTWHEVVLQALKRNDIRLVPYLPDRARGRGGRHRLRCVDGRHEGCGADADLRLRDAGKCAGLAGDPLSDSADYVRVRTRHARRIQLRAVAGLPHHASGARLAGDGASHRDAAPRGPVYCRTIQQT